MPTLLDSFFIEVGIDPRKYHEGARDVEESFAKTKNEFRSFAGGVEEQGKKISDVFRLMKGGIIGLVGGIAGAEVAKFIDGVADMDATTARLSHSIGMNVQGMSLWQGIVRQFGGTAQDARTTVASLADELTRVQQTGGPFSSGAFAALLQRSVPNWRDLTAKGDWNDILMGMARYVEQQPGTAAQKRFWLQSIPGMTPGMLYALQQGAKAINDAADAAKRAGLEDENAGQAAIDYSAKTQQLEMSLEQLARQTYPAMTAAVDTLADSLRNASNEADAFHGSFDPRKWDVKSFLLGPEGSNARKIWDYIFTPGANWSGLGKIIATPEKAGAAAPSGPGGGAGAPTAQQEAYIRQYAASIGVDPNQAIRVARSEGLGGAYAGDRGSSFGNFQLHYGGMAPGMMQPGLGDIFTKQTGLDAKDPSTWQAQVKFALDWAKTHGWGDWKGWKGAPWAGIGTVGAAAAARASSVTHNSANQKTSSVTIGQINITSSKADPKEVAMEVPAAVQRLTTAMGANYALS